ncbi:MAG: glycosyltransferase [Pirellulaceae bacterium]|nr:glycosyltransferase [Pirellulaceae bacterium]
MPATEISSNLTPFSPFVPTADAAPVELTVQAVPHIGKVLHVINGEHFSGAERVQQLLGKCLGDFGVQSEFVCLKPGKFPSLCGLEPDRVTSIPMRGRADLRVVHQLAEKVCAQEFDLLHAHTPRSALITALVAKRTGRPWCYHVHSPTSRDSTRGLVNRLNDWIERYSIRSCTRLLTVSRSLRREMLRLGVPRQRLSVVPNGVPAIQPIDSHARLDRQRWRLGLIALMRPRKGVEVALEAMAEIKRRDLPIELELIGGFESDQYRNQIQAHIDSWGLDGNVTWTGFTSDIASAIRRLDALLLPSLFGEGMPMVVLEALAAAVPVIATRVEGTPEVVRDGTEGLLAEPCDATSLTAKIIQMVSDRRRWQEMSRAALERHRQNYTDRIMAQRVAQVYASILGHAQR